MKKIIAAAVSAALSMGAVPAANVCAVTVDMSGISDYAVVTAATSGTCGASAEWNYADGKLTITGSGDMKNWEMSEKTPWARYKEEITAVEIDPKITKIGNCAFANIPNLSAIKIPDNVTEIGRGAFDTCPKLVSIDVPASCVKIGYGAFRNCASLQKVTIRNNSCEVNIDKETICNCADVGNIYYNGVIECGSGSKAEAYANKFGYKTAPIGSSPVTETTTTTTTTSTTTTTTTTTTTAVTTATVTTTTPNPQIVYNLGDVDVNGTIDAVDASYVLTEYANTSTGKAASFNGVISTIADADRNGKVDAVDASYILSYYAYTSTGTGVKMSFEDFIKQS